MERFFIEFLRTNQKYVLEILSRSSNNIIGDDIVRLYFIVNPLADLSLNLLNLSLFYLFSHLVLPKKLHIVEYIQIPED